MSITKKLIYWYSENKRNLPWRQHRHPFNIWLSEIILQQTRIDQGMDYYNRFVAEFKDVHALAAAPEEKVLRMWQGLGYYSRARNLHSAAKQIVTHYNGQFPKRYDELLKLKGVGDYTAAAIASIAFDEAVPVVDGNVKRVITRLFALKEDIGNQKTYNKIKEVCGELMANEEPGTFNQALMEFGALQCKPQKPDCLNCPLNAHCRAFESNLVSELPVKYKKQKKKNRYFSYFILEVQQVGLIFIEQREKKDIWQKLFQFPMFEGPQLLNEEQAIQKAHQWLPGIKITLTHSSKERRHILSHQNIHARFFHFTLSSMPEKTPEHWQPIQSGSLDNYAIPRLIEQYLKDKR